MGVYGFPLCVWTAVAFFDLLILMAGLDPAIYVDHRVKPGDEEKTNETALFRRNTN